jgi:hypothetical protein
MIGLTATVANASPLGTSYVAQVTNLPGDASSTLAFDGLESPLGSSGLRVREKTTSFGTYQLIEFSLKTADGEGFIGQQADPMAPASVSVSDLSWSVGSEDPTSARAESDSGFLWLSVDGEAQALSDFANLGLRFGNHPLDPSIPVVFIANSTNAALEFDRV